MRKKRTIDSKLITVIVLLIIPVIFTVLVKFVDVKPIGPDNNMIGFSKINEFFRDKIGTHMFLYKVTQLLGYLALLVVGFWGLGGAMQLFKRRHLLKVDRELLGAGVLYIVVLGLYALFEVLAINVRPIIMAGDTLPEPSFPSSHTLLACVVFISSALLCETYVFDQRKLKIVKAIFYGLTIFMVLARFLSGVHWFTDILGGLLYSLALVYCLKYYLDLQQK